jgi:hypothetical protein
MTKNVELNRLTENPGARRLWFIIEALDCMPLDRGARVGPERRGICNGCRACRPAEVEKVND